MPTDHPIANLPERITFALAELAAILFAIDVAVERTPPGSADHESARAARRLVTSRLWPGLGHLLDDGRNEEE